MNCHMIVEMSLLYMENKLNSNEKHSFESHIARCGKCHAGFELLRNNYNAAEYNKPVTSDIIAGIASGADKNKYKSRTTGGKLRRAWTVAAVSVILLAGVVANAETISKSLDELVNLMGREISPAIQEKMSEAPVKSDDAIAAQAFKEHKQEVYKAAESMKVGDVKELSFKWDNTDFSVKVGKTSKALSIAYKTSELSRYRIGNTIRNTKPNRASLKAEQLLQELIASGYFAPALDPALEGYILQMVNYSGNKVDSLSYTSSDGAIIYINIDSSIGSVIKNDFSTKTLEAVNGYQAVFQEFKGYGRKLGNINIYLGDGKRQKVISLSAQKSDGNSYNKEQLIDLACSIKFYNEQNNDESMIKNISELPRDILYTLPQESGKYTLESVLNREIFKHIKDPGIIGKIDEYVDKVKNGQSEFTIPVSEGVSIKRLKRGTDSNSLCLCYIEYDTGDFNEIKQFMSMPLYINSEIYSKSIFQSASCTYADEGANESDTGTHYQFIPVGTPEADIEKCQKLSVDANFLREEERLVLSAYTITDYMVDRFVTSNYLQGASQLVYDKSTHPYIVRSNNEYNVTCIETFAEKDGKYIQYYIFIPDSMLADMDYQTLVNGFKYIN